MWNFGNTTVRNPVRIQEGLRVFADGFEGHLSSAAKEAEFWNRLIETEVISKTATPDSDWNGRKWRSCFVKMGLITDKFYTTINGQKVELTDLARQLPEVSGIAYELTPVGKRLIEVDTQGAIEDIFLRQLVRLEVASPIETAKEKDSQIKPFILLLQILMALEQAELDAALSKAEIAAFLQPQTNHDHIPEIISSIRQYRQQRDTASGKAGKRAVDNQVIQDAAAGTSVKPDTLTDYADTTFRYSRLTGLFSVRGTRLLIQPEKIPLVEALLQKEPVFLAEQSPLDYLIDFYTGTKIPTDDEPVALQLIRTYEAKIIESGYTPEINVMQLQAADPQQLTDSRYQLEAQLRAIYELNYARDHFKKAEQIDDVLTYLQALGKRRYDPELAIDDAPVYLEWSVWRAFLTFNHLATHPSETRRFKIDMDLRPISHAPGGGADILMQYSDFTMVVEVTLTTSSRQEAAEGETVRRHVTRYARQSDKPVYGVFVAPEIDLNTAYVFKERIYYDRGEKVSFDIVPFTLKQVIKIIEVVRNSVDIAQKTPHDIRELIEACLKNCTQLEAPEWLVHIEQTITAWCKQSLP